MNVTVVIPSWKGRHLLERTLPTVLNQQNISYSVIVVENGIGDDTAQFVKEFHNTNAKLELLSLPKNLGYAGGVNAGIAAAKTKLVAVLCNDNEVEPNWLSELLKAYGSGITADGKTIGAVMSQTTLPGLDTSKRGTLNFLARNVNFPDEEIFHQAVPIFYPGGNAFLLDKSILPQPFDPLYFTYQEDVALGWRLRNRGYEVLYCHSSIARSFDGGTTKRTAARTAFLSERNRWINILSFLELGTLFRLLPLMKLDQLLSFLFGKNRIPKLHAVAWVLFCPGYWLKKRSEMQAERIVADKEVFSAMSGKVFSEPCGKIKSLYNLICQQFLGLLGIHFGL